MKGWCGCDSDVKINHGSTRNEHYGRKKKLRRLQKSQQMFFKIDTLVLERYCQANFASNMWGRCPWVIELVNKQIRCLLSSQQQGRCVVQFPTLNKMMVKIEITCVRKSLGHSSLADGQYPHCKQSTLYKKILSTVTACHRKEFQVPN